MPGPGGAAAGAGRTSWPIRWLVAFGRFWWNFLVGDTPELFVGVVAALALVAGLVHAHAPRAAAVCLLPALVIVLLWLTTRRGRPR